MNAGNSAQVVTGQSISRTNQDAPKDYLIPAILVTVFCCLPIGIVAIVKSVNVRRSIENGDFATAEESSKAAKKWTIIALIVGIIWITIWVIVRIATGIAAANAANEYN